MSRPTWARGLKQLDEYKNTLDMRMSRPTWARGLKLWMALISIFENHVAPHVGAWIETIIPSIMSGCISVAPHVGAWIETYLTTILQ